MVRRLNSSPIKILDYCQIVFVGVQVNLIRKAWKPYGVDISLKAPGIRSVIEWGTRVSEYNRPSRRPGKRVQPNKRPTY